MSRPPVISVEKKFRIVLSVLAGEVTIADAALWKKVSEQSVGRCIDGNTADGLRLTLADEFTSLYIYNLRGNRRTASEESRREGGKDFGAGSRNTVAMLIAIKNPARARPCQIHYKDVGDHLTREQKLGTINHSHLATTNWDIIGRRRPLLRPAALPRS